MILIYCVMYLCLVDEEDYNFPRITNETIEKHE